MSNILLLPQIEATFRIARNADWVDYIQFPLVNDDGTFSTTEVLDLGNIDFYAQIRPNMQDPNVLLDMSTINGKLINGAANGRISWHVSHADLQSVIVLRTINSAVMDILAVADGYRINLFQEAGPALIEVYHGVTLLAG